MADTIQIKRGVKAKLPVLPDGELGYCTDTGELYIGLSGANKLVGKVAWATDISALQGDVSTAKNNISALQTSVNNINTTVAGKLTATAAANVSDVAAEATTADVIASINTILANMRAAGLMKTS